ncbi:hypothetical protein CAPTEDRAFT_204654 [Capitella teleta]|uniref:SUEL-type lectin domain-containing protein n=1 Tax=Capitella teleta TaxID=283909 RepID=R7V7E2_CAPTE|nr:hypothetical protein CAPTEDRAFT_204654 [Capitella teleta]|eukprot:ELU14484.1 hypothetical protein CAPTEDRAFT_204654 [Capitella teleta]
MNALHQSLFLLIFVSSCAAFEVLDVITCYFDTLNIQCSSGHALRLVSVLFGRTVPDPDACPYYDGNVKQHHNNDINCISQYAPKELEDLCNDKNSVHRTVPDPDACPYYDGKVKQHHNNDINCISQYAPKELEDLCNDKNSCSVEVTLDELNVEDPCVNTYKYLNVSYICQDLRAARARDCFHLPRGNQRILRSHKANVQLAILAVRSSPRTKNRRASASIIVR